MPSYHPPLRDMQFVMHEVLNVVDELKLLPAHADIDADTINAVLEEGGKFASEVVFPINISGDTEGCTLNRDTHEVKAPEGFKQAYAQYVEGGWAALGCAPEYGGQGLTPDHNRAFNEELAGHEYPSRFAVPTFSPCASTLLEFGTAEQKAAHLPAILKGDEVWVQLLSEPGGGSDVAGITTGAVRNATGDWILNGSKVWTSRAWWADWGLILGCFKWTYAVLSPFGGYVADRFSKRWVIGGSLFVWSLVTWWTGHVTTFHELMAARAVMTALVIGLVFGGIVVIFWLGVQSAMHGEMSWGALFQFAFLSVMAAGAVGALGETWGDVQKAAGAMERITDLRCCGLALASAAAAASAWATSGATTASENPGAWTAAAASGSAAMCCVSPRRTASARHTPFLDSARACRPRTEASLWLAKLAPLSPSPASMLPASRPIRTPFLSA